MEGNEIVNYNPHQATLLEMRMDSERFPRLKTMTPEQAVIGVASIVSQAYLYRGQAADPTNVKFIAASLVNEINEDRIYGLNNLSLAEIQAVIKRAVLGSSEMFGVSVASLYKVLMEYVKGEGHEYQRQVVERRRKEADKAFKDSALSARISSATGQFIRNHKKK